MNKALFIFPLLLAYNDKDTSLQVDTDFDTNTAIVEDSGSDNDTDNDSDEAEESGQNIDTDTQEDSDTVTGETLSDSNSLVLGNGIELDLALIPGEPIHLRDIS